jgi:hypothetical protein
MSKAEGTGLAVSERRHESMLAILAEAWVQGIATPKAEIDLIHWGTAVAPLRCALSKMSSLSGF